MKSGKSAVYVNMITGQIFHFPRRSKQAERDMLMYYIGTFIIDKVTVEPHARGWELRVGIHKKNWKLLSLTDKMLGARAKYFENKLTEKMEQDGKTEKGTAGE